jgi:hypothetical protein
MAKSSSLPPTTRFNLENVSATPKKLRKKKI